MNKVIKSAVLLTALLGIGGALAAWKYNAVASSHAAGAHQPEPVEAVTAATAQAREHRSATTAIGTVLALRSVTLRNELAGTLGVPQVPTGAGHDAGVLAAHVPSAMLFVRNPTGISHAPEEHADTGDCLAGVAALADVLATLSGTDGMSADAISRVSPPHWGV